MPDKKSLKEQPESSGLSEKSKELKSRFDKFLEDKVSTPLYKAGFENLGPGIAAAGSSLAEMLVPESGAELAATVIPGGGIVKVGAKFFKKSAKSGELIPMAKELVDQAVKKGEKIIDATSQVKKAATKKNIKIDTDAPDSVLDYSKVSPSKADIKRSEKLKKLEMPETVFKDRVKGPSVSK